MAHLTGRFEMRLDTDTLAKVDDWRTDQPNLPTRSEAMRRLVELGLQQTGPSLFGVPLNDGERLIFAMLAKFTQVRPTLGYRRFMSKSQLISLLSLR